MVWQQCIGVAMDADLTIEPGCKCTNAFLAKGIVTEVQRLDFSVLGYSFADNS